LGVDFGGIEPRSIDAPIPRGARGCGFPEVIMKSLLLSLSPARGLAEKTGPALMAEHLVSS